MVLAAQPSNYDAGDADDLVFDAGEWNRPDWKIHNDSLTS